MRYLESGLSLTIRSVVYAREDRYNEDQEETNQANLNSMTTGYQDLDVPFVYQVSGALQIPITTDPSTLLKVHDIDIVASSELPLRTTQSGSNGFYQFKHVWGQYGGADNSTIDSSYVQVIAAHPDYSPSGLQAVPKFGFNTETDAVTEDIAEQDLYLTTP
ncbi:hypothetical protein D5085_18420 [Ectothiorhodospiraceae bacterium BW-2]|nr:hypothetical protein D5085_18420 [Ectothiorhodospiraceae bacterium BW-2]